MTSDRQRVPGAAQRNADKPSLSWPLIALRCAADPGPRLLVRERTGVPRQRCTAPLNLARAEHLLGDALHRARDTWRHNHRVAGNAARTASAGLTDAAREPLSRSRALRKLARP